MTLAAPRSVSAWTVWNPDLEWGAPAPVLWLSRDIAEEACKTRGLWPLRHGWRLIRVTVEPVAVASAYGGDEK